MKLNPRQLLDLYLEGRNQPNIHRIYTMMAPHLVSIDEEKQSLILGFPIRDWQLNDMGNLHGGMIFTAMDSTMGTLAGIFAPGHAGPTIQLSIDYVSPMTAGDELQVEAVIDYTGHRVTQTRGIARSAKTGKIIASAHASFLSQGRMED